MFQMIHEHEGIDPAQPDYILTEADIGLSYRAEIILMLNRGLRRLTVC